MGEKGFLGMRANSWWWFCCESESIGEDDEGIFVLACDLFLLTEAPPSRRRGGCIVTKVAKGRGVLCRRLQA